LSCSFAAWAATLIAQDNSRASPICFKPFMTFPPK
jgi:hypothetical protein